MNDLPGALEVLTSRVDQLEKRVHALEHPSEAIAARAENSIAHAAELTAEENLAEQTSGLFPVLGKGMLGIAGAYVLRAVAESNVFLRPAVAGCAVAYAMAWLVFATWSTHQAKLARVIYAFASALILAPMLWELTLHFKTFSPSAAAAILGAYTVLAALLTWKRDVAAPVAWVAHGAAAVAALALGIASHELLPFIATLLLQVALCEYRAVRGRGDGVRTLILLVSDIAIWTLIFIYGGPPSSRTDYPNLGTAALIAPAWLLWMINATGLTIKTVILQKTISVLEAIQSMVAFTLAVAGVLYFAPSSEMTLGLVCLLLAVGCYVEVFRPHKQPTERRNRIVFGSWSAVLALAGVTWLSPPSIAATLLGLGALVAIFLGAHIRSTMLDLHGLIFLLAAAVISRSPQYAFEELAGSTPANPGVILVVAALCAVLFYAAAKERPGEAWQQQILHFASGLLAALVISALVVQGLLGLAALAVNLEAHHIAFLRTLTLCAVSAAFAFGGSHWGRLEMKRIAYTALAFVAAKLLFEDLRHGRMEFIAGSIFVFALTLIAVPRLVRARTKTQHNTQVEAVLQKRG